MGYRAMQYPWVLIFLFIVALLRTRIVLVFKYCKFLHARHEVFHFVFREAACHIGPAMQMHL